jgi:hypothetical protein
MTADETLPLSPEPCFQLLRLLGEGQYGRVYQAKDTTLDRMVAIKFLTKLRPDAECFQRFQREAVAASRIKHSSVVGVHRFGITAEKQPYIVMEFVDGRSLRDLVKSEAPMPWERAVSLVMKIAAAMQTAHEAGVVHRDLKPGNVAVEESLNVAGKSEEKVRILDFGLASLQEKQSITMTDAMLGTPAYMSPEQFQTSQVDSRSDIYSLGCMLYECISGQLPFDADTSMSLAFAHANEQPLPIPAHLNIPPGVQAVLSHALEKSPEQRYQSMTEFKDDLALCLRNCSPSAMTITQGKLAAGTQRHSIVLRSLLLVMIGLALLVIAVQLGGEQTASGLAGIESRYLGAKEAEAALIGTARILRCFGLSDKACDILCGAALSAYSQDMMSDYKAAMSCSRLFPAESQLGKQYSNLAFDALRAGVDKSDPEIFSMPPEILVIMVNDSKPVLCASDRRQVQQLYMAIAGALFNNRRIAVKDQASKMLVLYREALRLEYLSYPRDTRFYEALLNAGEGWSESQLGMEDEAVRDIQKAILLHDRMSDAVNAVSLSLSNRYMAIFVLLRANEEPAARKQLEKALFFAAKGYTKENRIERLDYTKNLLRMVIFDFKRPVLADSVLTATILKLQGDKHINQEIMETLNAWLKACRHQPVELNLRKTPSRRKQA